MRRIRLEAVFRCRDRFANFVIHDDSRCRLARGELIVCHRDGQYVSDVARLLADGDQDRPIGYDQSDVALAWHVRGGQDAHHARMLKRWRNIDALHQRPWMVAETHGGVQRALDRDVVDVLEVPEHKLRSLIAVHARADLAGGVGRWQRFAPSHAGQQLDGIENLGVAGAAAEVRLQRIGDLLAARAGISFQQRHGPHDDAGNAKTALHPPGPNETVGDLLAQLAAEPFGGGHGLAFHPGCLESAGQLRLPVNQHGATAALSHRGTAVLRGNDAAAMAQDIQQRAFVIAFDRYGIAVKVESQYSRRPVG